MNLGFPQFDLEEVGLERSGSSVGFISIYSHANKSPWCRAMTKKTKKVNDKKSNDYFNVVVKTKEIRTKTKETHMNICRVSFSVCLL